jgi:hypothetical protein
MWRLQRRNIAILQHRMGDIVIADCYAKRRNAMKFVSLYQTSTPLECADMRSSRRGAKDQPAMK